MNCEKSCFNCKNAKCYGGSPDTRDYPGDAPMAECLLALDEKGNTLDETLFDLGEKNEWREEVMPSVCGHYEARVYEKCGECGKVMNSPEFSHELFVYQPFSGEPVAVCSEECLEAGTAKAVQESENEIPFFGKRAIRVLLACTKEMIDETTVRCIDVHEDIEGRDEVLFVCPSCGEEHFSLRFG